MRTIAAGGAVRRWVQAAHSYARIFSRVGPCWGTVHAACSSATQHAQRAACVCLLGRGSSSLLLLLLLLLGRLLLRALVLAAALLLLLRRPAHAGLLLRDEPLRMQQPAGVMLKGTDK